MVPQLDPYKINPKVTRFQSFLKFCKDYWVITSLIVAIFLITSYALLSSGHGNHPHQNPSEDPSYNPSQQDDDGKNPPYWISSFSNGGHFTNFSQVITEELSKHFQDLDKNNFKLNVTEGILNRQYQLYIFNLTEQIVQGLKFISLQDEILQDKLSEFEKTELDFEACKQMLLKRNVIMDNDSDNLIHENKTIAHEEGILQVMRDNLSLFQQNRKAEVNRTNIKISQMVMEKQQLSTNFEQSINKNQYIKDLNNQLVQADQLIEELERQIQIAKEEKYASDQKYSYNEGQSLLISQELSEIQFQIKRLSLTSEIDKIVERVKREEQISNTKELIKTIQKRIKLFNSYRIKSESISQDLLQVFESDKNQLKDLNNLQINLIKSFRKQSDSQGGKSLQSLQQNEALKKSQLEAIEREQKTRDEMTQKYLSKIIQLENQLKSAKEARDQLLTKIEEEQAVSHSHNDENDENTQKIKEELRKIDEQINDLKQKKQDDEKQYQKELGENIDKINEQKEHIKIVQNSYGQQISQRRNIEKRMLSDLNKCRSYRYMMSTIQLSVQESQDKVNTSKHNMRLTKKLLYQILDIIIPDNNQGKHIQINPQIDSKDSVEPIADYDDQNQINSNPPVNEENPDSENVDNQDGINEEVPLDNEVEINTPIPSQNDDNFIDNNNPSVDEENSDSEIPEKNHENQEDYHSSVYLEKQDLEIPENYHENQNEINSYNQDSEILERESSDSNQ